MRKTLLGSLALLLAAAVASPQGYNGYYCGATAFNINLGATTKSFQCRPSRLTVGQGTLTFTAADNTVTCAGGSCFYAVADIDAVPGSDNNFFNRSGLVAWLNGVAKWYGITTRTSSTSLEVADGSAAPATTATTTQWSYWNTTCYRSGQAYTSLTNANQDDQRLWSVLGSATMKVTSWQAPVSNAGIVATGGTPTSANFQDCVRPVWLKQYGNAGSATTFGTNTPGGLKLNVAAGSFNPPFFSTGVEFMLDVQSTAADAYVFTCIIRGE